MEETIIRITGTLIARVFDTWSGVLKQESINHNIVTNQGDALIADAMQDTPVRQRLQNANGYIVIGTGWTGGSPKSNTWVNTQVGSAQALAAGYPQLQASWGSNGQNQVNYLVTYAPGSLAFSGINEATLVTAATQGVATSCLAYAQISPSVNVTTSDTLQISWMITFLGS